MSTKIYLLFGYDIANKLEPLKNSTCDSLDFQSIPFKEFTALNSFAACKAKNLFLGWSLLLLKTSQELFLTGFQNKGSDQVNKVLSGFDDFCEVTCGMSISFVALKNELYYFSNSNFEIKSIDLKDEIIEIKNIDTEDLYTIVLTQGGKVFDIKMAENISVDQLHLKCSIVEVACGKEHILLLTCSGVILSYGIGSRGQLGHGNINKIDQPVVIEALDGLEIKTIAAGGWHSAAISYIGDLYMWGWNESGQLGLPCSQTCSSNPSCKVYTVCCFPKIIDLEDLKVLSVSCGSRHTGAITEDNSVWTWGCNEYNQLGHNKYLLSDKPEKVQLPDNFIPQSIKCKFWRSLITGHIK